MTTCAKCREPFPPELLYFQRWCGWCWKKYDVTVLWRAWLDYLHPPISQQEVCRQNSRKGNETKRQRRVDDPQPRK